MQHRPTSRRRAFVLAGLTAASGLTGRSALAQTRAADFPSRPIRVIVTFAAGSATDIMTRHLASHMSQTLGQNVVSRRNSVSTVTKSCRARRTQMSRRWSEVVIRLMPCGYS